MFEAAPVDTTTGRKGRLKLCPLCRRMLESDLVPIEEVIASIGVSSSSDSEDSAEGDAETSSQEGEVQVCSRCLPLPRSRRFIMLHASMHLLPAYPFASTSHLSVRVNSKGPATTSQSPEACIKKTLPTLQELEGSTSDGQPVGLRKLDALLQRQMPPSLQHGGGRVRRSRLKHKSRATEHDTSS